MEFVIAIFSGSVGAGIMSIILACLQRRWAKKDKKDGQIADLVGALKVLMVDRVWHLGGRYIEAQKIMEFPRV